MNIEQILQPLSLKRFLAEYFGNTFLFAKGQKGRFDSLFSWNDLNVLLRHHQLSFPQLRVLKNGLNIPIERYKTKRREAGRMIPEALSKELSQGATLIVDSVDELVEEVANLAESLERELYAPITVNTYAGWRSIPGFGIHRDDHDVIILQLAGPKEWRIYGETDKFALNTVSVSHFDKDPIWKSTITDGDILYIPRGWWHAAIPCEEPTLHLTVSIFNQTGIDLLGWVTERLQTKEEVRAPFPRFTTFDAQVKYLDVIRRLVSEELESPNLVDHFLTARQRHLTPRPRFGLPWTATPELLPPSLDYKIVVPHRECLEVARSQDSQVAVHFNNRVYYFDETAKILIDFLRGEGLPTIAEFYSRFDAQFEHEQLREFIRDLTSYGIISFTPPAKQHPK